MNRFETPEWVTKHLIYYNDWKEIPPVILQRIKHGLSKYNVDKPLVSLVIPVWNEEKNIIRLLSSLADAQLNQAVELIIVNNNSTDSTTEILDYMNVRYIHEFKQGIAHARLAGLKHSKGKIHVCGDGDSIYPPKWIDTLINPLIVDTNITCTYGNYSFVPTDNISRYTLGFYETASELLFEVRRLKREFLNVRGANMAFRREEGLFFKGFEMPITRKFDNDITKNNFVVFGEDGRMGRKLSQKGRLMLVRSSEARMWTSARRLLKDGSLSYAFLRRLKSEIVKMQDYILGPKKVKNTTDDLVLQMAS